MHCISWVTVPDRRSRAPDPGTATASAVAPEQATVPPSATTTEIATETPEAAVELPPSTPETERIEFDPGTAGTTIEGTLRVGDTKRYVLYAFAGQIMRVYVEPGGAVLRIYGEAGTKLKSQDDFDSFWRGEPPSTQDYFIEVIHSASAIGPWDRPLRISVLINPCGQAIQWVDYRDEDNGFELRYSDYFAVGTPPVIPPMRGEPVLSLRFTGSEYFQETSLGNVYFVVGKREEAEMVSNCTSPAYAHREQRDRDPPSLGLGLTGLP
jgi:hypothetical protein